MEYDAWIDLFKPIKTFSLGDAGLNKLNERFLWSICETKPGEYKIINGLKPVSALFYVSSSRSHRNKATKVVVDIQT